jgi:ABC-type nitrate/sulfonate/bicarbonate transport system ATPase subunit
MEFHVTGRRGHGKSTLIRALADHWGAQGKSVLTVTSTTPVADTGQWQRTATGYQTILPLMGRADAVLIECDGSSHPAAPLVEVWRADLDGPPLSGVHPSIMALISDGPLPYQIDVPVLPRGDIACIAAYLQRCCGRGD